MPKKKEYRIMKKIYSIFLVTAFACLFIGGPALAGPYTDFGEGVTISEINSWATGYLDYTPSPASDPTLDGQYVYGGGVADVEGSWQRFRTPENTTGVADGSIVSLGDLSPDQIAASVAPGEITLTFDKGIVNGQGNDFAVFENGFESWSGGFFAELGYVEVSTDGENFARFDSESLTPEAVGAYGGIDSTNVYNLAGKHAKLQGTGFDLDDLLQDTMVLAGLVDLNDINYVKVIDVPGSGDFSDAQGNPIYDAYETWGSGGFDLDAVGVINAVPLPAAIWLMGSGLLGLIGIRRRMNHV
jgi:hypothetical protein